VNGLFAFGIRQMFGGARRGQATVAGFGAALAIIAWLRDHNHDNELLYKRKLRPGEELRVRFLRGDSADDMTVTG
jgi:hypothetical protein